MEASDASHVCRTLSSRARRQSSAKCTVPNGLLGGRPGQAVSLAQLHSPEGILVAGGSPQVLLPMAGEEWQARPAGLLWAGAVTRSEHLLAMPRDRLHPAHIAFGLDSGLMDLPLRVKGMALLPSGLALSERGVEWVASLPLQWLGEAQDAEGMIRRLYPQLATASDGRQGAGGDWSCPVRKLVFWGSTTEGFGPITPNPVVAAALYPNLTGVHPLIYPDGPYARRADYATPNGVCYFRQKDPGAWPLLDAANAESQCSLLGSLRLLSQQAGAPVTIQEAFGGRCNDIIDTPDVGGRLRSGERLAAVDDLSEECGLLHRIAPAMVRVQGDAARVRASRAGLTTASEGGDCHMGRAARAAVGALQGKQCYTSGKTAASLRLVCPQLSLHHSFAFHVTFRLFL